MSVTQRAAIAIVAILSAFGAAESFAQQNESIQWSVTPYFWASDTKLDLSVQDTDINGGIEIPFSDLLDILDTAVQVHVEGGKGNWSTFFDITYLETSDTIDRPLVNIATNSKQTFVDAAVTEVVLNEATAACWAC